MMNAMHKSIRNISVPSNGVLRSLSSVKTSLYVKGCGVFGAVGLPELRDAKEFQALPWLSEDPITKISAGWGHSVVLTEQGRLFHWGRPFDFSTLMRIHRLYRVNNAFGRAVARSSNSKFFGEKVGYYPEATQVVHGYDISKKIVDMKASAGLTLFLTEEGKVYSYGLNRWMQCGVPMPTTASNNLHHFFPQHLSTLPAKVVQIDTGLQHAVALTAEGDVFTWGKGNRGQLGLGKAEDSSSLPKKVIINDMTVQGRIKTLKAKQVSAGFAYTAAITENDEVYIWGKFMSTTEKVSGSVTVAEDQWLPRPVSLPDGRTAKEIISR
jgi:alpha-tubulin suppressor-like RCC1 family protein